MLHLLPGNMGHLLTIVAFITSIVATIGFFKATTQTNELKKKQWLRFGRIYFYVHSAAVLGMMVALYAIVYNHYFEYHYAWSHSSRILPTEYMIASFWEGQEGSFLLWTFWNTILGIILMNTNKFWEGPIMAIFASVQLFLTSMVLGVVIPGLELKIGSSPFILLRDVMADPIFQTDPNFVPEDGTGLNPLLQNYWMVIHPPTLFLGFATTLIPFAYCIAGLWLQKFRDWIRPALPWAIFSVAVLGLGILMGGYWAYETLNFGGYWNWDPVENAIYVPWLILVAGIHTMIAYRKSSTALKAAIILVMAQFLLVLYSTFLVRSGILGDSSVHSFTDLGLSGQLLLYLFAYIGVSLFLSIRYWKRIPSDGQEVSTYSREFWIFIGVTVLCLMGFQVIFATSFPVINTIIQNLGGVSDLAPPEPEDYSMIQLFGAVALMLLSGTGQFFWWKKVDKKVLWKTLYVPIILTLFIGIIGLAGGIVSDPLHILVFTAGVYAVIANGKIFIDVVGNNPKLSGGAVSHIAIAFMILGILFSSGQSQVVSLNQTGRLITRDADEEFNKENLVLFQNEPVGMQGYQLLYKGRYIKARNMPGYVYSGDILQLPTEDFKALAVNPISHKGTTYFQPGDTITFDPENVYFKVSYHKGDKEAFTLYPRIQLNRTMGNVPSPDIRRVAIKDLYTHVRYAPYLTPEDKIEWTEPVVDTVALGQRFFINDYVAELQGLPREDSIPGLAFGEDISGVKAVVKIFGNQWEGDQTVEPLLLLRKEPDGNIQLITPEEEVFELGIRIKVLTILPDDVPKVVFSYASRQKDHIIYQAIQKPMINILWLGTLLLMVGFGIAIYRRYREFTLMRNKGQE